MSAGPLAYAYAAVVRVIHPSGCRPGRFHDLVPGPALADDYLGCGYSDFDFDVGPGPEVGFGYPKLPLYDPVLQELQ